MQLRFKLSKVLLGNFILLSILGLEQISALNLGHLIMLNAEGFYLQGVVHYLLYSHGVSRPGTCWLLLRRLGLTRFKCDRVSIDGTRKVLLSFEHTHFTSVQAMARASN